MTSQKLGCIILAVVVASITGSDAAKVPVSKLDPKTSSQGCQQTFHFPNGFTTIVEDGNVVLFECHSGYVPFGSMKSVCENGMWDQLPPLCAKKGCDQVKVPIHGEIADEIPGAVVRFQCEPGYQLRGAQELYCDGKKWIGVPPSCETLPRTPLANKTDL